MIGELTRHRITSGQARKGVRMGHPELSIECPQCHSAIGQRCLMRPGLLGITHSGRQAAYQKVKFCRDEVKPVEVASSGRDSGNYSVR